MHFCRLANHSILFSAVGADNVNESSGMIRAISNFRSVSTIEAVCDVNIV